jgi:glycosyltransferase involved in cell wall biosynthesis
MRKKKILIHSNFCKAFTGFGKHKKNILRYLFGLDKYEVIELANGRIWDDPSLSSTPWPCYGSLPNDPSVLAQLNKNPEAQRPAAYGFYGIDRAIDEVRPDVYLGIEDIWGLDFHGKPWWNSVTPIIWTTLDSLPILDVAFTAAEKTENFYVWSSFAEEAMKEKSPNVKTLHGSIDTEVFYPLNKNEKASLRAKNNISPKEFIIGFVFRNQLRKSVPNLLDGFMDFRRAQPDSNAKLLLHTHWSEGWDIPRLLEEKSIPANLVLTTYYCPACGQYEVKPFSGQQLDCGCGASKSQVTTNISSGVNESQLNEIYNMMDVYCHPFTSGGQEIPIQEAKLCNLITLVTDYSCGKDHVTAESGGLPLEWAEYREPGTQFIKASTYPSSIAKQLKKVYLMNRSKKEAMGKKSNQFVKDYYSVEAVGKKLEAILDAAPFVEDSEWEKLSKITEADKPLSVMDFLDKDDVGKRILVAIPDGVSDIILCNHLLTNFKSMYPEYNIYFATNPSCFGAIDSHPAIHRMIPFHQSFNEPLELEGTSEKESLFDMVFVPHATTQLATCHTHNALDRSGLKLLAFHNVFSGESL